MRHHHSSCPDTEEPPLTAPTRSSRRTDDTSSAIKLSSTEGAFFASTLDRAARAMQAQAQQNNTADFEEPFIELLQGMARRIRELQHENGQ
jgi:hypothetical protein